MLSHRACRRGALGQGAFALLAYSVSRRTREMGVRSAVGADPASVIWLVMREGVMLTAVGVILGLPTAYAGARFLNALTLASRPQTRSRSRWLRCFS